MAEIEDLMPQLSKLLKELDKRCKKYKVLESYYEDENSPLPDAILKAGVTKAYRLLMPMAAAPWGSLVVDSVQDRLEVSGVNTGSKQNDAAAWLAWQRNQMDSESLLGHNSALVSGRAFALVWPDEDGQVQISLDNSEQMIVQYQEGSRRNRVAALRRWVDDDDRTYCTLYRKDNLYKFVEAKEQTVKPGQRAQAGGKFWEMREVTGFANLPEPWPLPNPYNVVPVVELAVNRRLKPGSFGWARGEFAHCTGLIDRINLLTFLGLVVAFWMGFPLRAVIGDKIIRDDDGNELPPFKVGADEIVQFENPESKLVQLQAADRKNLSVAFELDQFATITKTPRHYFPLDGPISNIAEPTIRAFEGAMHAKIKGHKGTLGEGWEEILGLVGEMSDEDAFEFAPNASIVWADHESRSLAERADAAVKLASIDGLPWQLIAELALNLSQDQIVTAEASMGGDVITKLLRDTANTPSPMPVGANGQPSPS